MKPHTKIKLAMQAGRIFPALAIIGVFITLYSIASRPQSYGGIYVGLALLWPFGLWMALNFVLMPYLARRAERRFRARQRKADAQGQVR